MKENTCAAKKITHLPCSIHGIMAACTNLIRTMALAAVCCSVGLTVYCSFYKQIVVEPVPPAPRAVNLSAVIVGTIVNNAYRLPRALIAINKICAVFNRCTVLFYENDSWDTTAHRIHTADTPYDVHLMTERGVRQWLQNGSYRTSRLAHGRNVLLQRVKESYSMYDVMIVYDSDLIVGFAGPVAAVMQPGMYDKWPVSTSFSDAHYYDLWALRCCDGTNCKIDNCWATVPPTCHASLFPCLEYGRMAVDGEFRQVMSAFNGLAAYKIKPLLQNQCDYGNGMDEQGPDCEHVAFHKCLLKQNRNAVVVSKQELTYI